MGRQRDYKAEYARRLTRGRARGLSRQAARGHGRGEGKAVRLRPTTTTARQDARERGRVLREFADAIFRGKEGREPAGGIPGARPFKHSLGDRRVWRKKADVVFTFHGEPDEISPKWEEEAEKVFQAVPVRFTKLDRPRGAPEPWPPTIGDLLANWDYWVEYAASKTSLKDPELVDVYAIKGSML